MSFVTLISFLYCVFLLQPSFGQSDRFRVERERMVKNQIIARGVSDSAVLRAMGKVERHHFVPRPNKPFSYNDCPLPIGFNQTISQPYIVAYMTELLDLDKTDRVLEIGTGSGYQAAILAEIADTVFTIEIVEGLFNRTSPLIESLGYDNIITRLGDGYNGWPEKAPFDAIIVTAAPPEIPQPLLSQLKEGGRMIIPVGPVNSVQQLVMVNKRKGKIFSKELIPVRFVPFTRFN